LKTWATSPGRLSPNGNDTRIAVRNPASAVVTIRIGPRTRRSHAVVVLRTSGSPSAPKPPSGQNARRMTTMATSGIRMPSCGFTSAASVARIAARSGRSRHSSRSASRSTTTPTESTWPQTTLSNHDTGLSSTISAPTRAARSLPPSSMTMDQTR
jgi:hypothetical protein